MPSPISRPIVGEGQRIGDILRRVREHRDEDIESISDYLRIRPSYLVALENSQYEALPADAYVIGFLRTYALYLGLDGRGAIDQYRREMVGRRRKPQLSMPQPMSEGQVPTIALMIGAALAALLVYGLWYGLSTPDKAIVEQPLPLPKTTQEISPQETTAPPQEPSAAVPLQGITPIVIQPNEPKAGEKPTAPEDKDKPKTKNSVSPPQVQPVSTVTTPPSKKGEGDKKDTTPVKPTQTEPTPPPAATPVTPEVKTEATGKAPLTLRADKESWVLITDSKGVTIFDRTMKAGETYTVPAGKGLSLTTGNADGIVFSAGGSDLPKLHTTGRVVRAIPLDADKLKARLTKSETTTENQE
ncbi:MAG: RodZ domain-containing protein [Bdellovibrionales bacterium]|jgi:cytoskeletal protein RodZ